MCGEIRGGNVDSVCSILDRLLPEGLLVYTIDKNGSKEEEYADNEEVFGYTDGSSCKW